MRPRTDDKRATAALRYRSVVSGAVLMLTFGCGGLFGWALARHPHWGGPDIPEGALQTSPESSTPKASETAPGSLSPPSLRSAATASSAASLIDVSVTAGDDRKVHSLCHKRLNERKYIAEYLNDLGLLGEGAEIGVRDGDFSQWTLGNWRGAKLHLVDPWTTQASSIYKDVSNVEQQEQDARHDLVSSTMQRLFPGRYQIHRTYSVEAAKSVPDESLDYVYVDARHDYEGVAEDLAAWYPKLRKGGLLAGHDYIPNGEHKEGNFGVQRAVKEFTDKIGKEPLSVSSKDDNGGRAEPQTVDGGWTTFYFLK